MMEEFGGKIKILTFSSTHYLTSIGNLQLSVVLAQQKSTTF